ncbi:MAG TPA: hypothetical protein VEL76_18475 [Gemmataceae bacterium]|nr:hypothetical protein [Gemmataceae bacterium]
MIGGTVAGAGNVISGNGLHGVFLTDPGTTGNRVQGNEIGTDASGLVPVPNAGAGVFVSNSASNNTIGAAAAATPTSGPAPGGNLIADNDGKGVVIGFGLADNAVGNAFVGNVIFANGGAGGIGIDLGNDGLTANDVADADTGPNNLQNFPAISGAALDVNGNLVIDFSLTSLAGTYRVEFFLNNATDVNLPQGRFFLGSMIVVIANNGDTVSDTVTYVPTLERFTKSWSTKS